MRGRLELAPQLAERPLEDLLERAGAEERDTPCRRIRELAERCFAIARGEKLMEVGAVHVRRVPRRPIDQRTARPIERFESGCRRRHIGDRAETLVRHPPLPGQQTLFVHGHAFDLPLREIEIGIEERQTPEHAAQAADPPLTTTEVHDVGVSCVKTRRSQSSVFPIKLAPPGDAATISMVLKGIGVAHPFERSL